jgi:hypothetical protein
MAAKIITDLNLFEGDLSIPQKADQAKQALINNYIDRNEFEYIRKLLGYDLASQLYATIPPVISRFTDLLNGVEFTGNMGKEKWNGLKLNLARYIWCAYAKGELFTQITAAGEKIMEAQNASNADTVMRMKGVWDLMATEHITLFRYIDLNRSVFLEFTPYYIDRSLYKFYNPWF